MALAVHRARVQIEAKYNRIPRGKVKGKKKVEIPHLSILKQLVGVW